MDSDAPAAMLQASAEHSRKHTGNRSPKVWFPFYVGDYLADTMHLTTEEHGAYLLILCHQWRQGHLDESELRQVTRLSPDAWSIAQARLKHLLSIDESGRFYSSRLDREKSRWTEKSEQAHQKATVAANARWKRYREDKAKHGAQSNAPSTAQALPEQSPSSSPSLPSSLRSSGEEALPPPSATQGEDAAKMGKKASVRPQRSAGKSRTLPGVNGQEKAANPGSSVRDVLSDSVSRRLKWLLAETKEFWVRANDPAMASKDVVTADDLARVVWSDRDQEAAVDLLHEHPGLTQREVRRCLEHRFISVDLGYFSASLRPSKWLRDLPSFLAVPLNRFNEPVKRRGGHYLPSD